DRYPEHSEIACGGFDVWPVCVFGPLEFGAEPMVDRRITRIVAVLALVAAAGCTPRPTDELSIADLIPDTGAVLVWHVRTSDCLTCTLPDYDVRRLQAVDGDRFQLVVIHIGRESDQGVPSGFLQQRRIQPARIHTIGPRQYGTLFPDRTPPLVEPALLVVGRDRLPADRPHRRHALLPAHGSSLRARLDRAHLEQRL